jgi:hypothetical protein
LLNQAKADLNEQVNLTRSAGGSLRVEGVVESQQRKDAFLRALAPVSNNPAVKIEIFTVAEAIQRRAPARNISVQEAETTNDTVAADEELRQYFARRDPNGSTDEAIRSYSSRVVNSAYRCTINNEQNHRETTNHMGKALDIDFPLRPGEGKREDCERCNSVRGILVEKANCQIGWGAANRKALEPSDIAPSWVHMDVRSYEMQYLDKSFFVKTSAELDKFE